MALVYGRLQNQKDTGGSMAIQWVGSPNKNRHHLVPHQ